MITHHTLPARLATLLAAAFFIMHSSFFISAASAGEPRAIALWPEGVPGLRADAAPDKDTAMHSEAIHTPTMTFYPAPKGGATGTAVVVCPGGGYARLSMDNEGRKVAAWLNSIGVSAFVLKYRLKEYGQPAPLRDVLRAIRLVRSQAAEYGVNPGRIGVLGFSAGGHLASSATTLYNHTDGKTGNELDNTSARPDFSVLVYPVISMRLVAHKGSRENLLGKTPSPELVQMYSTDEQITKDTPPVFLVSGTDDKTVAVENSVRFYLALRKAGVPAEMHLYQKGAHGFGMKPGVGPASGWPLRCEEWMRLNGWIPAYAKPLKSAVYKWDEMKVVDTKTGQRRALYDGTTAALRRAESHITTLAPGATMHTPEHSHPDDEILIIKEGELEVTLDGVVQTAPSGSLVFLAGNEKHGMRNASDKPVTYYVLRFIPKELVLSPR